MSESLRTFLGTRERDLIASVKELRAKLAPLERELGEIRTAKAALGPAPKGDPAEMALAAIDEALKLDLTESGSEGPSGGRSMKDLTVRVLQERESASASELVQIFKDEFLRDVARSSLSPQLSRLRQEGIIDRDGKRWFLIKKSPDAQTSGRSLETGDKPVLSHSETEELSRGKGVFG